MNQDVESNRLQEKLTEVSQQITDRIEILKRICEIESNQHRAIREAILTGELTRLQEIEEEIAKLRTLL